MKARYAVLVAIVAAVTLTSVAAAGPDAAKQRVAIVMNDLPDGKFLLSPFQLGAVKSDSGRTSVALSGPNVVMREGQTIEVWRNTWTLTGKRGSLTIRERVEWIDAGQPFIGTGTWKLVRGTGQYAGIAGSGRSASAGLNRANGAWFVRYEGFLILP
ncbi:MAG TPA: hypothetical protein VI409_09665 [Gaiellaceae bacterium]|nr:hypothetical protein [Gaiellaceae bacterium]